jgi:hypothetical protein
MIDTDDYEGHTPGPWNIYGPYPLYRQAKVKSNGVANHEPFTSVDMQLIAAAPDLLAEVKRLRRVINDVVVDLTMMRLDDNQRPQFEDAVRAATETLSEVIDVD